MKPSPDSKLLWPLLTGVPGVGVSVVDAQGRLLFVNEMTMSLFEGRSGVDYEGKSIADFHPPEFVKERLAAIAQVLKTKRPLCMSHIYLGRRLDSFLYPVTSRTAPKRRVVVITRPTSERIDAGPIDSFDSEFIDLGPLDVLTPRELEVLVLLGHGLTIPQAAKRLHRSPKTIERHKSAISKKLKIHSHAAIVRLVSLLGLTIADIEKVRLSEPPVKKAQPTLPPSGPGD